MDDVIRRLKATLDDIVGRLRENHEKYFPDERAISQGVVLPVLRNLNWNHEDTTVVRPEYPTGEGRRVDFALCHPPGKPKIFVEVKKLGAADSGVKQALEYAFYIGVPFIVLTDGATWRFYLPAAQGSYEERRVFMLDLLERPTETEESAIDLHRYLERSRVVSGDAIHDAQEEHDSQRNRTNIRKAWKNLVDRRDKSLIELLANSTEAEAGIRPEDTDVVNFLASLHQRTSVSTPPPPPPSEEPEEPEKPRKTAAWWAGRIIRSTRTKNPRNGKIKGKGWHAHEFIMSHPDGVTYEDYRDAGYTLDHLKWDLERGYITAERFV